MAKEETLLMTEKKKFQNDFLLLRFKAGDELAFKHIFKTSYNPLVGFCRQFLNDLETSKSIAQEAFVNLWTERQKIEKSSGISAFLYTWAKSACLKYIRHQKVIEKYTQVRLNEIETQLHIETLESLDFYSYETIELRRSIQKAVENLPEKSRIVFEKKRFEGKSNKEIAKELGISVKSVEANMTRALKTLRADLTEYLILFLFFLLLYSVG